MVKVDAGTERALPIAQTSLRTADDLLDPAVWLVAAHGGAGTTFLSKMIAPFGDAGKQWPANERFPYCVVCCRSTLSGLESAHSAALQVISGHAGADTSLLGIVIIPDVPGVAPKPIRQRKRVLASVTKIWEIPYVPALRVLTATELAQWSPTDSQESKPPRKAAPTIQVPPGILTVATEILTAATHQHTSQKEEDKC